MLSQTSTGPAPVGMRDEGSAETSQYVASGNGEEGAVLNLTADTTRFLQQQPSPFRRSIVINRSPMKNSSEISLPVCVTYQFHNNLIIRQIQAKRRHSSSTKIS